MRPTKSFGGGIRSFVATDMSGNARELEATLANPADNGRALRSSLNLATELPAGHRPKEKRVIEVSTTKLTKFRLNLRDMRDTLLSVYLEQLQQFLRKKHKGKK